MDVAGFLTGAVSGLVIALPFGGLVGFLIGYRGGAKVRHSEADPADHDPDGLPADTPVIDLVWYPPHGPDLAAVSSTPPSPGNARVVWRPLNVSEPLAADDLLDAIGSVKRLRTLSGGDIPNGVIVTPAQIESLRAAFPRQLDDGQAPPPPVQPGDRGNYFAGVELLPFEFGQSASWPSHWRYVIDVRRSGR